MQVHHLSSAAGLPRKAADQLPGLQGIGSQIVRLREEADNLEAIFIRSVAEVQGWEAP
jgi:hypothetical protein